MNFSRKINSGAFSFSKTSLFICIHCNKNASTASQNYLEWDFLSIEVITAYAWHIASLVEEKARIAFILVLSILSFWTKLHQYSLSLEILWFRNVFIFRSFTSCVRYTRNVQCMWHAQSMNCNVLFSIFGIKSTTWQQNYNVLPTVCVCTVYSRSSHVVVSQSWVDMVSERWSINYKSQRAKKNKQHQMICRLLEAVELCIFYMFAEQYKMRKTQIIQKNAHIHILYAMHTLLAVAMCCALDVNCTNTKKCSCN